MKQVLLPPEFEGSGPLELRGAIFRHLVRVRRVRAGARLRGRTPDGRAYELAVQSIGRSSLTVVPVAPRAAQDEAAFQITLLQCVPKGPRLDLIVRQAVEAGVSRIVLVASERSLVRPGGWPERLQRLERIAREALEQSGAAVLPSIHPPVPLVELRCASHDLCLFLHERPLGCLEAAAANVYSSAPSAAEADGSAAHAAVGCGLHDYLADSPRRVALLVGPEGGLAEREVRWLCEAGFRPVYLGDTVLRVETAAIFVLGAVKTLLRERERWTLRESR